MTMTAFSSDGNLAADLPEGWLASKVVNDQATSASWN